MPDESGATATVTVGVNLGPRRLDATIDVPAGLTPLAGVLPIIQRIADVVVERGVEDDAARGCAVSCRKGCGACCRQLVPVSPVEARQLAALVAALPEPRRWWVLARFAEARARLADAGLLEKLADRDAWDDAETVAVGAQYFRLGIACPFLEDESCSIHADRPISCREFLVTTPAEYCSAPDDHLIRRVDLPVQVLPALAQFEEIDPQAAYFHWVPLVLALDWAAGHPDRSPERTGPQWMASFFDHLSRQSAASATPPDAPV